MISETDLHLHDSLSGARTLDLADPLSKLREEFEFPKTPNGENQLYFAGHSLGLMPKRAREYVDKELDSWGKLGVEGHFKGDHPWLPYHELITESFAGVVGAKPSEVVAMNSLTVNLHLMLVSFYRPTKKRYKILIENNAFPSDKYAVDSQARFHGFNPQDSIIELTPKPGELTVSNESVIEQVEKCGDSLALVLLGNCNYLSGQAFNFEQITKASHKCGATVGFNLAHGAGNLELNLHDWDVDFAVWCSYKYLNAGPGGIAGTFVHERHFEDKTIPRFEGWWGHEKTTRFKMGPDFKAIKTVEAWQLSNPPIFQLASLRASLELFDKATMPALNLRGKKLTSYFEYLVSTNLKNEVTVLTPQGPHRGSMLSLKFKNNSKSFTEKLHEKGVVVDFREPNIIRATPAPLYNSYEDIYNLVQVIKNEIQS
jgi:kynureninase